MTSSKEETCKGAEERKEGKVFLEDAKKKH